MADHPWFGATREDRYIARPEDATMELEVSVTLPGGTPQAFRTHLHHPTPAHVETALNRLRDAAIQHIRGAAQ